MPTPSKYLFDLPSGMARKPSAKQQAELDEASSGLFPGDSFPSAGTPATELLASPKKQGIAAALGTLAATSAVGGLFSSNKWAGAGKGALYGMPLAIIVGLIAAEKRKDKNEEIIDTIMRYPEQANVTQRDIDAAKGVRSRIVFGRTNGGSDIH